MYRASQVGSCELPCNIRRRELYDDLLSFRPRFSLQAKGWKIAIHSLPVVDVGEKELWNGFGGELESNVNAILEGSMEEDMRFKLVRRGALDSTRPS